MWVRFSPWSFKIFCMFVFLICWGGGGLVHRCYNPWRKEGGAPDCPVTWNASCVCSISPRNRTGAGLAILRHAKGLFTSRTAIHCCPDFYIHFARPASLYCEHFIYTHIRLLRDYMNYLCFQITLRVKTFFTQIGSGAKCWLDICHCGAGLAVTDRIPDIGQNHVQFSFQTERGRSPSYFQIFFLIAFLEEAFIRNIIIPCINYIIIICINNNNNNNNSAVIIMEGSRTLFCSWKFPCAREIFLRNL
jgi:hypothetical protein